jgi:hypothetical protein
MSNRASASRHAIAAFAVSLRGIGTPSRNANLARPSLHLNN